MKIAIISPNQNAYSETFIQAHKNLLGEDIEYFFGGNLPNHWEGKGPLNGSNRSERVINKIAHKFPKISSEFPLFGQYMFAKALKKAKPQVVLAEYGPTGVKILSVCKSLNIPLVVHFHGYDASVKDVLKRHKDDYQALFRYASFIISVSKPMNEKLMAAGCPQDKLVLNPYGPSHEFLSLEPTYSENALVAIGRFVDKKAPYYTILAFKQVVKKFPNTVLYMAGDGVLRETCMNLVNYLGLAKNIEFLGVITQEEYQNLLCKVKGFVQHSITAISGDMEGTPVAIIEASAAGIPVIATRHAGIPEVIVDGETGLLVDEHDVDHMAQCMLRILRGNDLARQLGDSGKKRIRDHYSMSRHISNLKSVLERAANQETF